MAVATTVAKSYLSFARVLAASFLRYHPDIPFFVLLADEVDDCFVPAAEPFRLLRLADLKIPGLADLRFRYSQQELTYSATGYLLSHLLDRGFSGAAFLKQESLVLGDMTDVFSTMDHHSIVLVPHLLAPLPGKEGIARELNILQSGVYNVGFLGVSGKPCARAFLTWWQDRLRDHCRHDVPQGMHFEQRWLDLVPAYFDDVHILRDPGFNVGHWNLPERDVRLDGDRVLAGEEPCRFFRFSGFDPDQPLAVTKYSSRLTMANAGPAAELFARYRTLLEDAGYSETKGWPYAYGHFDNGVPIPGAARRFHRELGDRSAQFGDPFQTGKPGSYFNWLNEPIDDRSDPFGTITRFWRAVYDQRPDVRQTYPDLCGADREAFITWTEQFGIREHGVAERFLVHPSRPAPRLRSVQLRTCESTLGVNLAGRFASEKGIGEAARSLERGLAAAGIAYVLNNYEDPLSSNEERTLTGFSNASPYPVNLLCADPVAMPAFTALHAATYLAGHHNVAHWAWEFSDFPRAWAPYFEHLDEVWVASTFVQQAVAKVSPIPVRTVPYCIRDDLHARACGPDVTLPADRMIFLFVFDFASHFARKNPLGLVRAFKRAFGRHDDVLLVLKCARSHLAPADLARLREAAEGARVEFIDRVLPRQQVLSLMRRADCYVSLHRTEGFGLTLAEAMDLGKPVVATGYSGNLDFMTASNSFLVDYRLVPVQQNWGPYTEGHVWADPDLDHAAALMRLVYEDRARAQEVGRRARQDILARLHPRVVGEHVGRLLSAATGGGVRAAV
ncbi:MAG: hypothetical protein A3H96_12280 [Acidobacteria bacterium RIFCSPLOWO2_02_FULL_67_36]|nr:MAG: hypothetical protein A3H96_12280 [Acidobacteria bacterium RIFCSPLOWO2_02_FULL_67_36]